MKGIEYKRMGNEISLIIIIVLGLSFLKSISSNNSHKKEIKKLKEQDVLQTQPEQEQEDDLQSEPVVVNGEKKYSPYSLEYIGRYKIKKSIFDSDMEMKISPELRSFINDGYYIVPQVGWRTVFQGKSV